jgi:hypothetical protein
MSGTTRDRVKRDGPTQGGQGMRATRAMPGHAGILQNEKILAVTVEALETATRSEFLSLYARDSYIRFLRDREEYNYFPFRGLLLVKSSRHPSCAAGAGSEVTDPSAENDRTRCGGGLVLVPAGAWRRKAGVQRPSSTSDATSPVEAAITSPRRGRQCRSPRFAGATGKGASCRGMRRT